MSTSFMIDHRQVGGDAPCFVVAELSANHAGRLETALATVEAAAASGADAIKLQTYTPDTLTLNVGRPPFVVAAENAWQGRTLYDLYQEAMTPWEWHAQLKACAESLGLICFSSPFDHSALDYLEALEMPAHKVASFELTDLPLLEHVARTRKPVIISTGLGTLADIDSAVRLCRDVGNEKIALLRCVSSYPAPPESMALRSIETLKGFGTVVGLSDHSTTATTAVAAVALGAKVIEKHFILDRSLGGPDAFFSLEPSDFVDLVKSVRTAESALGKAVFGPGKAESKTKQFRRSLFVVRDVEAGEVLTQDHVRSVRPANGLAPHHLPEILGRKARRNLSMGTPLDWSHVDVRPEMPRGLYLREATSDDGNARRTWNKAEVLGADEARARSLSAILQSSRHRLYLACRQDQHQGMVWLEDRGHGLSRVSIATAPDHEDEALGTWMLRLIEDRARELGLLMLVAELSLQDEADIRSFKQAGYYACNERRTADGPRLCCERRIRAYA